MKRRYLVIILILFLAVGYAGVSVVQMIGGNIDIAYDENNFNVEFTRVSSSFGEYSFNKKSFDFKTINLKNIGDEALLEFEIANKSLDYDADVNFSYSLKNISQSLSEYLDIKADVTSPIKLSSGNSVVVQLTIKMKKAYTGLNGITPEITCVLNAMPTSRTNVGKTYVESYKDPVLNGADPIVKDRLIPVKLSMDGTVTMADTTKRWYSYKNKEWANAVILVDNPSKTYNVNDVIKESDIESYFVWIPRYKYQIFNTGNYTTTLTSSLPSASNAQEIQIEFESNSVARSNGSTKGSWLTHPAFTNYNTNGIWVGKFETGYRGATNEASGRVDAIDASKVIIKPNVYTWRGLCVSNMFKNALNYSSSLNSHMMRNTEWGAAAYLSHSKYGIKRKVRINNYLDLKTGYAANSEDLDETGSSLYNTEIGYLASTTGNITGIYDMNGGTLEYVAACRGGTPGNSGFTTSELSLYAAYLDIYNSASSIKTYDVRILGDATGEMGPFYINGDGFAINNWYGEYSHIVEKNFPWFNRSGSIYDKLGSGQFYFDRYTGEADIVGGFRITLAF